LSAISYSPHVRAERLPSARVIDALLFLTILVSPFVFIEPSPYEAMWALLLAVCLFSSMKLDRKVVPLIVLLLFWNLNGLVALMPVTYDAKAVMFMATSFYLAINAVMFAFLLSESPLRRVGIIETSYVIAALIASLIGLAIYFKLVPVSDPTMLERIRSTFKDPNVFGPFLILPIFFLLDRFMRDGFNFFRIAAAGILLITLLLVFSRGAWGHFVATGIIWTVLIFLTAPSAHFRYRVIGFLLLALAALSMLFVVLLSFDSIGAMFKERANLLNEYDAGQGGRFGTQVKSLTGLLEVPFGVGPLQFSKLFGQDPHNTYINAFASYGWLGGITYLILVVSTVVAGLRTALMHSPWQRYLIVALAAYIGVVLEGAIIDTDHWRHYYLLLGMVWGLAAATISHRAAGGTAAAAASDR
jgi:hypothetical protein